MTSELLLEIIKKKVKARDNKKGHLSRQARLQEHVDVFGLKVVAAAGNLKESSLKTYLRDRNPRIDRGLVMQVEDILLSDEVQHAYNEL